MKDFEAKKLIALFLAIVLFIPFVVFPGILYPFTTIKALLFFLLTLLGVLIILVRARTINTNIFRSPFFLFCAGFLVLQILSAIVGVSFERSFFGTPERMMGLFTSLQFFLFFWLHFETLNLQQFLSIFRASIFSSILVALIALTQYFFPGTFLDVKSPPEMVALLGNKAFLGYYLLLHAFLSLWMAKQRDRFSMLLYGVFVLHLLTLLLLGVRGVYLGLLMGIAAIILAQVVPSVRQQGLKAYLRSRSTLLLSLAIAVLLLIQISSRIENKYPESKLAHTIRRVSQISFNNSSIQNRLIIWNLSWKAFQEKPILGWGPENFELAYNRHYDPQLLTPGLSDTWFDRAHNSFLDILVMNGIAGGLLFLAFWGFVLFHLRKDPVLLGLFTAFFVTSLTEVEGFVSLVILIMLIAFLAKRSAEGRPAHHRSIALPLRLIGVAGVLLSMAYLISFSAGMILSHKAVTEQLKDMNTDAFLSRFDQGYQWSILAPQVRRDSLQYSIVYFLQIGYERKLTELPLPLLQYWDNKIREQDLPTEEVKARYFFGKLYREWTRGDPAKFDTAHRLFLNALEVNPKRQAVLFALSSLLDLKDDPQSQHDGFEYLHKAVAANPEAGTSHFLLGRTYLIHGLRLEAIASFEKALEKGYVIRSPTEVFDIDALLTEAKKIDLLKKYYAQAVLQYPGSKKIRNRLLELQDL